MPKQHLTQVDYIRAIASLAVALFHLGGKTLPVLSYGWLGVEMFFLLSGFIICWAIPSAYTLKLSGKFLLKRIARIEPPYIISIVFAIIAHFVFVVHYKPDWLNILSHLGYINNFTQKPYLSPVYWTLGVEFQFYIFVALFFQIINKKWSPLVLLLLCIAPIYINTGLIDLFHFFPLFTLGIIFFLYKKGIIEWWKLLIYALLVTIFSFKDVGVPETAAALFALALLALPLKSNRVISFLSKISFSLYLTHDVIGSNIVAYLGTRLPKTIMYKGFEFLTGIIISIIFAYIFFLLVEKPALKLSKKIHYYQAAILSDN